MAKCSECKAEVRHVRDNFTGATFPVDVEPRRVRGFVLLPPEEGERNQRAELQEVELYSPHVASCPQTSLEEEGSDG